MNNDQISFLSLHARPAGILSFPPVTYKTRIILRVRKEAYEYIWVIDQTWPVKMAGYWPDSFPPC